MGLAEKAGALAVGSASVARAVESGRAKLLVVAGDASERTTSRFQRLAGRRFLEIIRVSDRESLGRALGSPRPVAIAAVTDESFASGLLKHREVLRPLSGRGGEDQWQK
ncbi:MAG: ribosomal L7Ae/L30e/S12e/Gadd45 family protein [Firmicutes bacterium]|nr:ribosomal L7Ae/L30e/S12e/Gadd45 family protein [Bacillota bacterium]